MADAAELIFHDSIWTVERQPHGVTNPLVVRFQKRTAFSERLDQMAEWDPERNNWSPFRWRPTSPVVPVWMQLLVARRLREVVARA